MDGDEQVRLLLVGDGGASLKRDKSIVTAGVNHVRAKPGTQQLAQPSSHIKYEFLLFKTVGTDGAGIVAAMPGVDDDPPDFQTERPYERTVTSGGGLGLVDFWLGFGSFSPGLAG